MDLISLFVSFILSTSFNLIHLLLLYDDDDDDEQEKEEKRKRRKEACFQFISNANSIKSYRVSVYSSGRIHLNLNMHCLYICVYIYVRTFAVPLI